MVFKRSPCYAALGKYASSGIVPLLVNRFPHNLHTFLLSNVGTILLFLCLSPYYTHSSFSLWDWKWCGTWNKPFCGSFFSLWHTQRMRSPEVNLTILTLPFGWIPWLLPEPNPSVVWVYLRTSRLFGWRKRIIYTIFPQISSLVSSN